MLWWEFSDFRRQREVPLMCGQKIAAIALPQRLNRISALSNARTLFGFRAGRNMSCLWAILFPHSGSDKLRAHQTVDLKCCSRSFVIISAASAGVYLIGLPIVTVIAPGFAKCFLAAANS